MCQTAEYKQDSYDLACTRHMHDEFIKLITLKITYALAKNQYGLGCICHSGCYGPEIRQDIHVFTASMTMYGLVDVIITETNSDANKFELMLGRN